MKKIPFLILLFLFACGSNQTITKNTTDIKVEPKPNPPSDIQYEKDELGEMEEAAPPKTTDIEEAINVEPIYGPFVNFGDRKVLFIPPMEFKPTQSGFVTLEICIKKDGSVKSTSIAKEKTNIIDKKMLDYFLERGKKYKFSSSASAPEIHCGSLNFAITKEN